MNEFLAEIGIETRLPDEPSAAMFEEHAQLTLAILEELPAISPALLRYCQLGIAMVFYGNLAVDDPDGAEIHAQAIRAVIDQDDLPPPDLSTLIGTKTRPCS